MLDVPLDQSEHEEVGELGSDFNRAVHCALRNQEAMHALAPAEPHESLNSWRRFATFAEVRGKLVHHQHATAGRARDPDRGVKLVLGLLDVVQLLLRHHAEPRLPRRFDDVIPRFGNLAFVAPPAVVVRDRIERDESRTRRG